MKRTTMGIDIAKNVFEVRGGPHSLDRNSEMLSEVFCAIFVFNERSRRWPDDLDAIIPRHLRRKSR